MNAPRWKAVVALALMLTAFATAQAWRPTTHMADTRAKLDLEVMFPKAFGGWRIDEHMPAQLISPDQAEVLNRIYNQTLSRTYVNGDGERMMLSVAYGGDQSDGTRAHRPEVCYPAQGFQILSNRKADLELPDRSVNVRVLMAKLNARAEPITYWVTVGTQVATSGTEQKLAQLRYGLRGIIPDGMLVRVSSIDPEAARGHREQARFIAAMETAVPAAMRPLIFGDAPR